MLLEYLQVYPIDHHSREIVDSLPKCIELGLPNLHSYFDERLLQTQSAMQIKKGLLRED
jgi:GTPase Era involved in 16S rRNA processing